MKQKQTRFLIQLGCIGLIMMALTLFVKPFIPMWITPYWSILILFFVALCAALFFLIEKVKSHDMRKFANFFMATTVIKLVIYLIIILAYSLKFPADAKPFMLTFLAYYLIFTVFETYTLVRKNKNSSIKK